MGKYKAVIVDVDGAVRENPDFPTAILRRGELGEGDVVDPVFNDKITRNLYGRIMTLLEATTDPVKLKSVKDVFSKELRSWEKEVYDEAFELCSRVE